MHDFAEAAASLADRGWAVFPLIPGRKEPAVKWRSEQEWSKDPDYVYDNWPDGYNIGIACGPSGLLVVDCDVKHGKDGISDFRRVVGGKPATFTVSTPSGGEHYYYKTSRTWSNATGSLPASIDIRGSGGLVVAPGSEIGGVTYEIKLDTDPPDPVPAALRSRIEWVSSNRGRFRNQQSGWKNQQPVSWKWKRRPAVLLKRDIETICDRVAVSPEGERNAVLYWASCRLAEIVGSGRITDDDAEADLLAAAQTCGLPDDEALKSIRSALAGAR